MLNYVNFQWVFKAGLSGFSIAQRKASLSSYDQAKKNSELLAALKAGAQVDDPDPQGIRGKPRDEYRVTIPGQDPKYYTKDEMANAHRIIAMRSAIKVIIQPHPEGKPWQRDFPPTTTMTNIAVLKKHPDYAAAKAGDRDAAYNVVTDMIKQSLKRDKSGIQKLRERHPDAVFVPVHAEEEQGKNALPATFATMLSSLLDMPVDSGIIQTNKVSRTGKGNDYRMANKPRFSGNIKKGQEYVLVDDAMAFGGTLNSLRAYIESKGGIVVDSAVLAASRYGPSLPMKPKTKQFLEDMYGTKELRDFMASNHLYGGEHEALTEAEAKWFIRAKTLKRARERIMAARLGRSPIAP